MSTVLATTELQSRKSKLQKVCSSPSPSLKNKHSPSNIHSVVNSVRLPHIVKKEETAEHSGKRPKTMAPAPGPITPRLFLQTFPIAPLPQHCNITSINPITGLKIFYYFLVPPFFSCINNSLCTNLL